MGFRTVDNTPDGRGGALERGLFGGKLKVNRSGAKSAPSQVYAVLAYTELCGTLVSLAKFAVNI